MKKMLFIMALIVSASSYSAISISGGAISGNYSFSNNSSGGKDLSGVLSFTGNNPIIDLTLSATYGKGKHKFKTLNGLGTINSAEYKGCIPF